MADPDEKTRRAVRAYQAEVAPLLRAAAALVAAAPVSWTIHADGTLEQHLPRASRELLHWVNECCASAARRHGLTLAGTDDARGNDGA